MGGERKTPPKGAPPRPDAGILSNRLLNNKQYLYALKNGGKYWREEGMGELVPDLERATLYWETGDWEADEEEGDEIVVIEATLRDTGKKVLKKVTLITEDKEKYIRKGGTECPFCGAYNIDRQEPSIYEGVITVSTFCENCTRDWLEIYPLKDIQVTT